MSYQQPPQFEPGSGQAPSSGGGGYGYAPTAGQGLQPAFYRGRYGYVGPARFEPLSPWSYFGHSLLFSIPLIGWVFLIVDCFTRRNVNLRSFARSYLCAFALVLILAALAAVILDFAGTSFTPGGLNLNA